MRRKGALLEKKEFLFSESEGKRQLCAEGSPSQSNRERTDSLGEWPDITWQKTGKTFSALSTPAISLTGRRKLFGMAISEKIVNESLKCNGKFSGKVYWR